LDILIRWESYKSSPHSSDYTFRTNKTITWRCGHDHIGIYFQKFISDAVIQAVCNDSAGSLIDENRQSFNHGKGDVIQGDIFDVAETFHWEFRPPS
jgi:hypothetical protein